MTDSIPDEERENLMVALHNEGAYCGLCSFEDAVFEELDDEGRVEWRCRDCEKCLAKYVDAILSAGFRRVSPVTREDVRELIAEVRYYRTDGGPKRDGEVYASGLVKRLADALEALSVSPPAEVEWEKQWQNEDGDWTGDASLAKRWADEGSELWTRTVTTPKWVPVSPERGE